MKKICLICNKELGIMNVKLKLADGYICMECWKKAGFSTKMTDLDSCSQYTAKDISNIINASEKNSEAIANFKPTSVICNMLKFSNETKMFVVTEVKLMGANRNELFHYNQILNFELLEDGASITKGGLGAAAAGGIIFGGTGAIVGGITGGKKTKSVCNSLRLKITFKDCYRSNIYIDLIEAPSKTTGIIYKEMYRIAQDSLSALQIACDQIANEEEIKRKEEVKEKEREKTEAETNKEAFSAADEILKFKKLSDEGIISKEEFETKKKQLLGI